RKLGLHGFVINSHTNNEYLDQPKYWPILEAAEALNAPIYIHPRAPSASCGLSTIPTSRRLPPSRESRRRPCRTRNAR
ncbi:MAG: amidohydrolase family protein, partial [Acidobacteria bacterium]|nr:amidohydrolase family protein [Acidobacteriota bacterium]